MSRTEYLNKTLTKELLEQSYINLGSIKAVARKLSLSPGSIKKYMLQYDLKFKSQVRYNCDHNFFSQDNENSFYIAGFIAADGCVKYKKNSNGKQRYQLQIGLSKKDKDFLEMLRTTMKAESPIRDFLIRNSKRNPNWNDSWKSEITIESEEICKSLKRFNIIPRKSLIYTFPEWMKTHPLKHHFIRGYNDGDGSFYKPKLPNNKYTQQIYFTMRGTPEFLIDVRSILEKECNFDKTRNSPIRISSGHGCLEYGGNGVVCKITNYLYQNANIFLSRKKEIAMQAKTINNCSSLILNEPTCS